MSRENGDRDAVMEGLMEDETATLGDENPPSRLLA